MKLLEQIDNPQDLKKLKIEELPQLCAEIRNFLLESLSVNPGHLGSNLGVVELTVAMHYVYNTPYDKIVWDVGHQAYIHKILTGRRKQFDTLRKKDGLAGFPHPSESEYDTFTAGHASNSISAAIGMAVAAKVKGEDRKVVAVIGDGSMTGGMAFEGLNNASSFDNDLLIILNDNNISIDRNVGGLNKYMVKLLTSHTYNTFRGSLYKGLRKLKVFGKDAHKDLQSINNKLKSFVARQNTIFDSFSLRYLGPVDGHNVIELVHVLQDIKDTSGPKLLHISTTKGKGYSHAEASPTVWHAPGKFDVNTGERLGIAKNNPTPPKFQDVFGHTLVELAAQDERIVGITPAMPSGCSMNMLMKAFPKRAYDVGIAEEHAVTFASGLATQGLIPFCNIYSTFMQRAYDQLIHDVALQGTKVIFCLDRAGLVGEDGATHQGAFDIAYLRTIPNMSVCAPMDEVQLRHLMYSAYKDWEGAIAIRYPRGNGSVVNWQCPMEHYPFGKGRILSEGEKVCVLSIGPIGVNIQSIVKQLANEEHIHIGHADMVFAKPLDTELLDNILKRYQTIITVEEGTLIGGIGSAITDYIVDNHHNHRVFRLGIPDNFIPHATPKEQREMCGLDDLSIYECCKKAFSDSNT